MTRQPSLFILFLLAACGESGQISAPDGGPGPSGADGLPLDFVFHDGEQFIATGFDDGSFIATSRDGDRFTRTPTLTDVPLWSVSGEPGRFVAVGSTYIDVVEPIVAQVMYRSEDALQWTSVTPPDAELLSSIAFGNGTFVALASTWETTVALRSTDGATWSETDLGPLWGTLPEIAYIGGRFVAWGIGEAIMESSDGITWQGVSGMVTVVHELTPFGDGLVGMATYDCCYGEVPEEIVRIAMRWTEAGGWTGLVRPNDPWIEDLVAVGSRVIAVGDRGISIADGEPEDWQWQTIVSSGRYRSVASDGADTLVAARGDGKSPALVSQDRGESWQPIPLDPP